MFEARNGFVAGTYVQPVNVWIQAEQKILGIQPPSFDFYEMGFLTRGAGLDADGNMWGPLDPVP